jgi:hypothetical protein
MKSFSYTPLPNDGKADRVHEAEVLVMVLGKSLIGVPP